MPNILVNTSCEAQFFNPESRWDSTTCAHMARPLPYKASSHSHTTMVNNSWAAASPSLCQGIVQPNNSWGWSNPDQGAH